MGRQGRLQAQGAQASHSCVDTRHAAAGPQRLLAASAAIQTPCDAAAAPAAAAEIVCIAAGSKRPDVSQVQVDR
jgi:hypothetical protein